MKAPDKTVETYEVWEIANGQFDHSVASFGGDSKAAADHCDKLMSDGRGKFVAIRVMVEQDGPEKS